MRALVLLGIACCGDPGAPRGTSDMPSSVETPTGAAAAPGTSAPSATATEPVTTMATSLLALRHELAFETYNFAHVGIDQYHQKPTLTLAAMDFSEGGASKTCRRFTHLGRSQVVCAVHGDVPTDGGVSVALPSDLTPANAAGRHAALDVLCIDLALRESSARRSWAYSPEAHASMTTQIDWSKAHVFVAVDGMTGQITPLASRPWRAPCVPVWEQPGYRPGLMRLPAQAWLLVWDRR